MSGTWTEDLTSLTVTKSRKDECHKASFSKLILQGYSSCNTDGNDSIPFTQIWLRDISCVPMYMIHQNRQTLMLAELWEWRKEFGLENSSLSFQLWRPLPLEVSFSKPRWLARIWGQGRHSIVSAKYSSDSALNTCIFDLGYGLTRFTSCFLSLNPQWNFGSIAKYWQCKGKLR